MSLLIGDSVFLLVSILFVVTASFESCLILFLNDVVWFFLFLLISLVFIFLLMFLSFFFKYFLLYKFEIKKSDDTN